MFTIYTDLLSFHAKFDISIACYDQVLSDVFLH